MRQLYFLLGLLFFSPIAWAQPANDECIDAIPLTDVTEWCSEIDAYTNEGATISPQDNPSCFPNNQDIFDVWFSFEAVAPNVALSVIGEVDINDGGTIQDPQFALYSGSCDNLIQLACTSDAFNNDFVNIFQTGLEIGEIYYIRISARFEQTGTFQLCVDNFNEIPEPSGDCEPGVILCDKSPFTVPQLIGVGNDPNEIDDNVCDGGTCPNFAESGSTWYKWTCDEPGPLAFTLTPQNPADDLDFIVYELPNGIDDCSGKISLRCMASGENVGQPFSEWFACTGATGLSTADPDEFESCGCEAGDNNFASAVNMESGKSYALVVNNFSQSGGGFTIEFDQSPGTGTFLGPEANFSFAPEVACVGETVTFEDNSSYIGTLVEYKWVFGSGAVPAAATGPGPHNVIYGTPGFKTVILEVTADRGCIVSEIQVATEVVCCDDHFAVDADITNVDCPNAMTGAIDITVTNDFPPYSYNWDNGETTEDISNLAPGLYTVEVSDESTCTESFSFTVESPPPFTFDTLVVMPTCDGGTDGAVTLVVNGGTPPYEYNWENAGFGSDNTLANISQGDYTVIVRDANGCTLTQVLPVRELQLTLDPTVQAITQPSCFGFSDGVIEIAINNGLPAYQYNFNLGDGFGPSNTLTDIPAGTYQVDVLDANLCAGNFELVVEDHPPLALDFAITDVSCFGESDGIAEALVTGGVGNYSYDWSNGPTTAINDNLPAGDYDLTVLDGNNCVISGTAPVAQPDSLGLDLLEVIDNICFGESDGSITVGANGGNPPYEYSLDGFTFQTDPVFTGVAAGDFQVEVLDALGCSAFVDATVTQPIELLVDAGPDRLIQLGYDTLVRAVSNYAPVTFEWTPVDSLDCLNTDCSLVLVNPTNTTTYQVLVINEDGCTAIDLVTIRVIKDRPVYIPNIFSPNGDGINDGFTIFGGPGLEEIERLQIFSRWGSLVYETENILPNIESLGWNGWFKGQPVNPGVFVYVAQLRFADQEVIQVEGDVTVIR